MPQEEEKDCISAGSSQIQSEDIKSVFIDEMLAGSDLNFILDKNPRNPNEIKPSNSSEVDEGVVEQSKEDDDSSENLSGSESDELACMTEEQKRELKARQQKLLADYYKKLKVMRQEELTR